MSISPVAQCEIVVVKCESVSTIVVYAAGHKSRGGTCPAIGYDTSTVAQNIWRLMADMPTHRCRVTARRGPDRRCGATEAAPSPGHTIRGGQIP